MKTSQLNHQRKLKALLQRPDIWRGNARAELRTAITKKPLQTGYDQLDKALVQQGWPLGGVIEITQSELGMGEWQLIRPALRRLENTPGYTVLINPPETPYAPGLQAGRLNLQHFLIITPKNRTAGIAACIEALANSACKALLFWESHYKLKPQELRRLQLAATGTNAFCLLFRHHNTLRQSSPALLRLSLHISHEALLVNLIKQRGAFQRQTLNIDLPETWRTLPALSSETWLQSLNDATHTAHVLPFNQQHPQR